MKRILPYVVTAAALVSTSCHKSPQATVSDPVRVETMAVSGEDVADARSYPATVVEGSGAAMSFTVPGTISRIYVAEGERVSKGQLIATINDSSLQEAYNISATALAQAQDTYDRMKKLHEANALADMKWVEAENALKAAKSQEAIARKTLSDAAIYAPFDGYVSKKYVDEGMSVAPIEPVVKVVQIDPIKVSISVSEADLAKIGDVTEAKLTINTLPGQTFIGRGAQKAVAANPITRSYEVNFVIDNPDKTLLPGMLGTVTLASDSVSADTSIVLPLKAVLLAADNSQFVWVDSCGYAVKRTVEVAGFTDTGLIISGGINRGDSVIVAGQQKVSRMTPVVSINH